MRLPCWDCYLNKHGFCAQRQGRKFCCCPRPQTESRLTQAGRILSTGGLSLVFERKRRAEGEAV